MTQVVGYPEFEAVVKRLDSLERENHFLRKMLSAIIWLSKDQAAEIIGVSSTTVWRLMKRGELTYRYVGHRVFFHIDSIRDYMMDNSVNSIRIESPVFPARRGQERHSEGRKY